MSMLEHVRKGKDGTLVLGNHAAIVQSMLDFDYLSGKKEPSVAGIIAGNRSAQKFFFGKSEVLVPCFKSVADVPKHLRPRVKWMLNLQSGRRAYESTVAFFEAFPQALGGHIFAENMHEMQATELIARFGRKHLIAGPSGVGILVPGHLKLGAIGGVDMHQIEAGKLSTAGSGAGGSTSGGV